MNNQFNKRIFTAGLFFSDLGYFIVQIPQLISAYRNKDISKAFIEKIMTVTSAVNGCTYCSWFHAKQAVSSGISKEEIKNMINLQFQAEASDFELAALLYAQHFAETNRQPEPEMTTKYFNFYGEKNAKDLFVFIRMINFGNLFGNTWDAVKSRFKGNPAVNSNVLFELFFFLISFWFMIPLMFIAKDVKE
ncbi:MAG TPA: carboxymuconolactone decarboxylase family protein [Flavobacterium sp.]|nr:carboxymuconolactone decarboxylase family protein [Flavobacterium sp.]